MLNIREGESENLQGRHGDETHKDQRKRRKAKGKMERRKAKGERRRLNLINPSPQLMRR